MKTIGHALGWIMQFCFDLTKNYGIAIILFTFITKIFLFPVSIITQKNSIKMIKMMPEENALKIKYIDDKDKLADERLALYKKYKYNPFVSLIPLFIQIPLVLGLVYVVYHPLSFTLRLDDATVHSLKEWLMNVSYDLASHENTYQLEIINQIKHGVSPDSSALSPAVQSIRQLGMQFLGFDLSLTPSFKENHKLLVIPVLSGLSALIMCTVQNKINVLQITQGKLNKVLTTLFMVAFSTYFAFFVPAGVGLYWIFGNLFSIPSMCLLNVVIPPKKYIDYDYLIKMNEKRIEKEKISKQYSAREKADYKRFFSTDNVRLVFYSEQNGFYKYFSGMIDYICSNSDIVIHYVTSDPNDKIFEDQRKQIVPYYISSDKYLIPLFMKLECDICVLTVPDLEKYHIKRSRVKDDIEYIFVSHSIGSYALTLRKGALDWYDTIFCTGIDNLNEIRDAEELYHTPKKRLVEAGYPLLDEMIAKYESTAHIKNKVPKLLIAPSWQPDNIIDSCAESLLSELSKGSYDVILRPHPQQVRHESEKFDMLKEKYKDCPNIEIQTDFSSNSPIMESDIVITDWSNIAFEFAFVTKRPVLFINTPMKIMNPEYELIKTKPINITLRSVIGKELEPDNLSQINDIIDDMLSHPTKYKSVIEKTRNDHVYNVGKSGLLCGKYIIRSYSGKI